MSDLDEDAQERYDQVRRMIASALARWRAREEMTLAEMKGRTGIGKKRLRAALLATWHPSLKDLVRIEVESEMTLFVTIRNT